MYNRLRQFLKNPEAKPVFFKFLAFLVLFGITFYGAVGMAKSFASVHRQKKDKQSELTSIEQRIGTIDSQSSLKNDFQKEKALREKLHMVKPGEDLIIILPEEGEE